MRPIFAISDLHMGDGGPRDNFASGNRETQLISFLEFVRDNHGKLVICGDLFELWQSNISKVLTRRMWLLDILAKMRATYVLGNHDADLRYFLGSKGWLTHPFFRRMCVSCSIMLAGKSFEFLHGHEADPYCSGDTPGLGRITAIYTGIKEDHNGGPMLTEFETVEQRAIGRMEHLLDFRNWLHRKPHRLAGLSKRLRAASGADVVISGHTHSPGRIGVWHYNCGTWAERVNSFVYVAPDGAVGVFDWLGFRPAPNPTELPS